MEEQIIKLTRQIEALTKRVDELESLVGIKKKEQIQLFPEPDKTAFRQSIAFTEQRLKEQFANEIEAGIDIDHYVMLVAEWSDNLPTRTKTQRDKALRSPEGWISTMKTWMRKDQKSGKLKMIQKADQRLSDDQKEYILNMAGSWN